MTQRLLIVGSTVVELLASNRKVSAVVSSIVFNILFCAAVVILDMSHTMYSFLFDIAASWVWLRNASVSLT